MKRAFLTTPDEGADAAAAIHKQNAGLNHNRNWSRKLWLGIASRSRIDNCPGSPIAGLADSMGNPGRLLARR
jgi:hypothetical protein